MMSRLMLNLHEWGDDGIITTTRTHLDTLAFENATFTDVTDLPEP